MRVFLRKKEDFSRKARDGAALIPFYGTAKFNASLISGTCT